MQNEGAPRAAPRAAMKALIVSFAVFYVVGTLLYLAPPFSVRDLIASPLIATWHFFGWSQGWSVFAPRLRRYNPHATATVTFTDGSTELYEFPRMEKLNLWDRFRREKWRKFAVDNMPWSIASYYHEDVARYVARDAFRDPSNPPMQVALTIHWAVVPELPAVVPSDRFPEHDKAASFFVYRVRKKDLQP